MPSDTRTYIKLHDGMPEHPKIVSVGGDAAWLHVCAVAYCSRNLSDGVLPKAVIPRLSDRKNVPKLVQSLSKAGLWHEDGHDCARCVQPGNDSVILHDYLEHQRSREHIEAVRESRSKAGSKGGRPKATGNQIASGLDTDGLPDGESKPESPRNPVSVSEGLLRNPQTEEPLRGSQTEVPLADASGAIAPQRAAAIEPSSQTLLAEWIDACRSAPPGRVKGQVAKEIKALLDEGIPYDDVRNGLALWHSKQLHPSTIPSVVHEARLGPRQVTTRQTQTDDLFARSLERIEARERGTA